MTVGTAHTGKPSVSSANTAARLPTEPRATWLEMTMTARGASAFSLFMEFLDRDDVSLNRHPDLSLFWSMIFSENRFPLFGIML
jgi:hypothetical protein